MSARDEILALEEQLRQAELGPDPAFFERHLADNAVLDGQLQKSKVVAAHQPSGSAKFTKVEMSDFQLQEHGAAVVVTCSGLYEGPMGSHSLKFMRVWLKEAAAWRIIAASIWQQK
ncbi:MAG TPA: nuclear transport factor 2 family protein [Polyangiaceae bacterium]|nr:nuclear transport factor 2 family protein [Polyangiaceae bacterium]